MAWLWNWNSNVTDDMNFTTEIQSSSSVDNHSTRKIVKSNCRTEEVEPGRFVRKCEKTVEVLKDCLGKPTEVVESTKEYTESDITGQVKISSSSKAGDSESHPFEFPGLQRDIEAMERSLFGGISRFLYAAEGMFRVFDDLPSSRSEPPFSSHPSSSTRSSPGIPIEDHIQKPTAKPNDDGSAVIDLSGLARDV